MPKGSSGTGSILIRCAFVAVLLRLVDGLKIVSDMLSPGQPDWLSFLVFALLMVALTCPILIRSGGA